MTKEQRLELLKQIEKDIYIPSIESTFLDEAKSCAIHSVIEELEQESDLDKIRAEIIALPYQKIFGNVSNYSLLDVVIEIIDKYKAKSEDK